MPPLIALLILVAVEVAKIAFDEKGA